MSVTSLSLTESLDSVLRESVKSGLIPGVVAVAATSDGVVYEGAFGPRALGTDSAMTTDTVFWLGSMTKMIVAIGALQLVERGKLSLDAPLGTLLPQLAELQVLEGFDDDGLPVLRAARTAVTLRHLLTHTAGNGYHFWNADVLRYQEVMGLPGIIECREVTLTTPLTFDPGTAWQYGMNIDWVGKAIEKVSGVSLEDYLRAALLDPLGMSDTTFVLTAGIRARLAGMHARTPDGLVPIEFEMTQEPEFQMAGGAMYGSARDYLTLLRMLLGRGALGGVRVLSEDLVDEALRNQIGGLRIGPIATVDPASSNDVDFLAGIDKTWGLLGLRNEAPSTQGRSTGSLFWAGLGNTYFWVDQGSDDCGLLCTQILPFADQAVLDTFDSFERTVHHR
ncbi:serine hydrolase domain-containing protein [Streptomyces sp. NPDC005820]|uniref:serine hydrolase domain-containing protein n=1 Tax=Streptomyces sp. NPDC005820 TaxID=3157069 RepID=UPI0033E82A51